MPSPMTEAMINQRHARRGNLITRLGMQVKYPTGFRKAVSSLAHQELEYLAESPHLLNEVVRIVQLSEAQLIQELASKLGITVTIIVTPKEKPTWQSVACVENPNNIDYRIGLPSGFEKMPQWARNKNHIIPKTVYGQDGFKDLAHRLLLSRVRVNIYLNILSEKRAIAAANPASWDPTDVENYIGGYM